MADYFEAFGFNLLKNSSDPDGDAIAVRKIGTSVGTLAVPGSYPATYSLTIGTITVLNSAGDCKITLATDTSNPNAGATIAAGTIYFTTIDARGLESTGNATATVNLQGSTGGSTAYVSTGLVERWAADVGRTMSGSNVASWLGQVQGLNLTAVGTPTVGTAPGGTAGSVISIGDASGFTGSTLTGMPVGAAARTLQMLWRVTGFAFFGGFGGGSNANNQAFTIAADDAGEIGLDYKGNRVTTRMIPANTWLTTTATYDGTTIKVYIGDILVASQAVALATGASLINVCRSFSGYTTHADIGEIIVYGRELSAAEISANVAYLNARFIGSLAVSDPTFTAATAVAETSFTANVTVGTPYAVVAWSARASSTAATEAQILAGTGAISFGLAICNGSGVVALPVTNGVASTAYYVNVVKYGLTGGKSAVVKSAAITTTAAPVANPVLSSPVLIATSDTTLSGAATTDTGNGTLKYGLMLGTATTPNLTQLEAGTDGDGNPLIGGLRTLPVTATGVQTVSFTGLIDGTAYKSAYGQRNGSNGPSNIVSATATTQTVAVSSSLTPDATSATPAGVLAIIDAWIASPISTIPPGKTINDPRVVQLTAPVGAGWTISGKDCSGIPGGVIIRGIGPYDHLATYPYYATCGSHVDGTITLSGCKNIRLTRITAKKIAITNSPGCTVDRSGVHSRWSTTRSVPSVAGPGIAASGSVGATIHDNHVGGFNTVTIDVAPGCDDISIEGNYPEQWSDDLFKFRIGSTTINRPKVKNNWAGRDNLSQPGAHSDFQQNQSGTVNSLEFTGNFVLEGASLNGISVHSFLWQSNTNVAPDTVCEQNLFFGRGSETYDSAGGSTSAIARYNTAIYCETGAHGSAQTGGWNAPKIVGGWNTNEFNFCTKFNSGSANTAGTGGVTFQIGDTSVAGMVANTSGYATYWDGFPSEAGYIDQCKPKVGSPAHWAFSGQKIGGWQRSEEIWVQGKHPGNVGWPVAGPFHREYDPLNTLGSSWTGNYDADGNNLTPAPTSITINDPSLPVYDSDPHGVGKARITFTGTHNRDGSTLQIMVINPANSATVVNWADFTAGAGGAWSAVVDVPRGWNACRAVVRAKSNTAVTATQAADFRSGYIWAILGQSEAQRVFSVATSTAALTPPAKSLWIKDNSASGSASAAPVEVTGSSVLNHRRMACAVSTFSDAPMMIVINAENGTGLGETVDANETTNRSWVGTVETPVQYVQSRGSDCALEMWHWPGAADGAVQLEYERWAAPAMLKQAYNSLNDNPDASGLVPYTSGSVQVQPARAYTPVHFFWDMNGTGQGLFNFPRTRFVLWHGASHMNPQGANGSFAANDMQKGKFRKAQMLASTGAAIGQITLNSKAGWTGQTAFGGHLAMPEGTHINDDTGEHDGEALVGVYMVLAACRALGTMIAKEPKITAISDSGTYWDVEFDLPHGGNLSTPLIQYNAGAYAGSFEATNWIAPTAFTEADMATLHEVAGFTVWTGATASWTGFTAVIQNAGTGTVPNRRGTVRVTPTGGTSGKTLSYGYADGYNMISVADAKAARIYTHHLIETRATHVSGTGYGYPAVRQSGDTAIVIYP